MTIFEFQIGPFTLGPTYYGLMYALGFIISYILLLKQGRFERGRLDTLFVYLFLGVILGGRLGYVLFYNPLHYLSHPLDILKTWHGGMSFHGGLIGVMLAIFLYNLRFKIGYRKIHDWIVWVVPIGLFFGRIGNYINGELLGIPGYSGPLAVEKLGNTFFPTPLLEAALEGVVLFAILYHIQKKPKYPGQVGVVFLLGYGIFRFIAEYFRIPDLHIGYIGGFITVGQILSLVMIGAALILIPILKKMRP